jgi:hypothetical protein
MFWNVFGVKTCGCSGVPWEGIRIAYLSSSTSATRTANVRNSFGWRKLASGTMHGRSFLGLLRKNSRNWLLSQCHDVEDLSVLIVCSKYFVWNSRGFEETRASGAESCFNGGRCGCFIPCFNENIAMAVLCESAIGAVVIKQQKMFILAMLKWSKDRPIRHLHFMGSWKA